jgi:hypothetical protein
MLVLLAHGVEEQTQTQHESPLSTRELLHIGRSYMQAKRGLGLSPIDLDKYGCGVIDNQFGNFVQELSNFNFAGF